MAVERRPEPPAAGAEAGADALAALDHVVIQSPAPDAAIALDRDQLGLRLALDRSFEARGVRLIFFRIAGATVEIAGQLGREADADAPDRFWGTAYRTADIGAARRRLERDFDLTPIRDGNKPGTRVFTVRDAPAGVPTLVIGPA